LISFDLRMGPDTNLGGIKMTRRMSALLLFSLMSTFVLWPIATAYAIDLQGHGANWKILDTCWAQAIGESLYAPP